MNEGEDYGNLPNQFPPFVQEVLDKFKVVMLSNLLKKLPLRHEVNYEIKSQVLNLQPCYATTWRPLSFRSCENNLSIYRTWAIFAHLKLHSTN